MIRAGFHNHSDVDEMADPSARLKVAIGGVSDLALMASKGVVSVWSIDRGTSAPCYLPRGVRVEGITASTIRRIR
jgi:hypothetical protein